MSSSWPDVEKLKSRLSIIDGVTIPPDDVIEDFILSSIDSFQGDTGWEPFLASSSTSRIVDTPDYLDGSLKLYLDNGVQSGDITIYSGYQISPLIAGTLLTENEDYRILDRNVIEFLTGITNQLNITTKWGYDTVVPGRAFETVINKTILELLRSSGNSSARAVKFEQDTVKFTFNNKSFLDDLETKYNEDVDFYLRMTP